MNEPGFWDIAVAARTVWGEARGQPFDGQLAVAWVMINRARDRRWPNSLAEVCLQPLQFSAWNTKDPNRKRLITAPDDDPDLMIATAAVLQALSGRVSSPVANANHYLNPRAVRRMPSWYDQDKVVCVIGDHTFLRL